MSYLAACDSNTVFSEYTLYEPILRVLVAQKYDVTCEWVCRGFKRKGPGDHKRIDFQASVKVNDSAADTSNILASNERDFALEVKWVQPKKNPPSLKTDFEKLVWYKNKHELHGSYLCVMGTHESLKKLKLDENQFKLIPGRCAVQALWKHTQYVCRMYEALPKVAS